MRTPTMLKAAVSGVALLLLFPTGAQADQVNPDGDVTVDSTAVTLTGACSLPSTQVAGRVEVKRTGGGQQQQHFQAGTAVSVAYQPSSSQVLVSGPTSVPVPATYSNGTVGAFTFDIQTQVRPGTSAAGLSGSATVTVQVSGPDGAGGTYRVTGTYPVSWNCTTPVNSPPTVSVEGVGDGATYEFGAVPAATCRVVDVEDGESVFAATLSPLVGPRTTSGLGTRTATCAATDTGGLSSTTTATFTVEDTTAPTLPELDDVVKEATSRAGAAVTYTVPGATDAVDGNVPVSCTPASGATFGLSVSVVTCTATDTEGNSASGTFTVTVADTTAPKLDLPDSITLDATSPAGAAHEFTATATDKVDGEVPVSCTPASGATFGFGPTTVECTAVDAATNKASGSFVVTVRDVTAPKVTVPADHVLEATSSMGAPLIFEASAVDDVDGPLDVRCDPASGSTFALGATTVTCSATDAHANTGSAGFIVTVQDTTPPTLRLPSDITLEATGPLGAVAAFQVSATDIVDGAVEVDCTSASGDQFRLGPTAVDCWATDATGNRVEGSFTVTVVDTTPPVLPDYENLTAEATSGAGALVGFDPGVATDIVDGDVTVVCLPASGQVFALGETTVTCTATDAARNRSSDDFTVTVKDTTAPQLRLPANSVMEATGPLTAITYEPATATDAVDADPQVTCTPASGSPHGLGGVEVICTAVDDAGNHSSGSFTVTVQDTTAPRVEDLADVKVEATSAAGALVTYGTVSATDAVDGSLAATCTPASGGVFPLGVTTVTCSATDSSDNTGENGFTVTVEDTTAPVVTITGAPEALTATGAAGAAVTFAATAADTVDGTVPVTCTLPDGSAVASGAMLPLGTTTVTCAATDAAGNTGTRSFTVTITVGWGGFGQPLNPGGPAAFKLNSTIPVKFTLTGASAGITDLNARLYVRRLDGAIQAAGETQAVATGAANTGNAFRWDADGRQYVFNLATKPLGAGTYELRVDLGDGVPHTIQVVIRK